MSPTPLRPHPATVPISYLRQYNASRWFLPLGESRNVAMSTSLPSGGRALGLARLCQDMGWRLMAGSLPHHPLIIPWFSHAHISSQAEPNRPTALLRHHQHMQMRSAITSCHRWSNHNASPHSNQPFPGKKPPFAQMRTGSGEKQWSPGCHGPFVP